MPNIVGGCLCGSVRYERRGGTHLTAVCHCHHCQKQMSSAFRSLSSSRREPSNRGRIPGGFRGRGR